MGIGEGHAV